MAPERVRVLLGHLAAGRGVREAARAAGHETIDQGIYVSPRGELKRELQASLRSGRGKIVDAVPTGARPAEVEGRLVPGHHEGDLILGSPASGSAAGTIVERMTGYLTLPHLPGRHDAASVADAVIEQM